MFLSSGVENLHVLVATSPLGIGTKSLPFRSGGQSDSLISGCPFLALHILARKAHVETLRAEHHRDSILLFFEQACAWRGECLAMSPYVTFSIASFEVYTD